MTYPNFIAARSLKESKTEIKKSNHCNISQKSVALQTMINEDEKAASGLLSALLYS